MEDAVHCQLEKAKQDDKGKDIVIKKMEDAVHCLETKMKAKDTTNKLLQDRVKELESQLLVARKLARRHIDTKLAENVFHEQKQHQQQKVTGRFGSKLFHTNSHTVINHDETDEPTTAFREISNMIAPLADNSIHKNKMALFQDKIPKDLVTRENKPQFIDEARQREPNRLSIGSLNAEVSMIPRKLNRLSTYTAQKTLDVPAPRRSTLIPIQSQCYPSSALADTYTVDSLLKIPSTCAPINQNAEPRGTKKSIMRRSLQKKVIIRTSMDGIKERI